MRCCLPTVDLEYVIESIKLSDRYLLRGGKSLAKQFSAMMLGQKLKTLGAKGGISISSSN